MQGRTRRKGLTRPARTRNREASPRSPSAIRSDPRAPFIDAHAMLELQRLAGNASARELAVPSGGQPLDDTTRTFMEQRFGHDFRSVRIHRDEAATASARSIGAHAYTVGNDIAFQSRLYNPHSTAGRRMLAHELAHVVQQRFARPAGTPIPGGAEITARGDRFEHEADRAVREVMSPDTRPSSGTARP
jgi:hypothetical protein